MNYSKHIKEKNFLKFTLINEENIHWFIIDQNQDYLLIINDCDFIINGYSIIRKDIISSKRYWKYEKFYEKLFALNKINIPKNNIKIDFLKLLNKFKQSKQMISIEKHTKKSFELWIIKKIWSDYINLKPISADWKREKQKKIFLSNIDIFSRWNNYCKIYNKLIK